MYQIIRHPLVQDDLDGIFYYIADFAGPNIGQAIVSKIVDRMESLSDFPQIGTIRSDIHPGLRVIPASEKGVLCFTVDTDLRTVFIVLVSYAGADWMSRVSDRLED